MENVKETEELLAFVADVLVGIEKAKSDDRRISMPEAVGLITMNLSGLLSAVMGAGKIPAEARDYTTEELEHLYDFFLTRMGWNPTDNNRDRARAYFVLIRNLYTDILLILNTERPPRALAA